VTASGAFLRRVRHADRVGRPALGSVRSKLYPQINRRRLTATSNECPAKQLSDLPRQTHNGTLPLNLLWAPITSIYRWFAGRQSVVEYVARIEKQLASAEGQ
jgi:hypothetical protein